MIRGSGRTVWVWQFFVMLDFSVLLQIYPVPALGRPDGSGVGGQRGRFNRSRGRLNKTATHNITKFILGPQKLSTLLQKIITSSTNGAVPTGCPRA